MPVAWPRMAVARPAYLGPSPVCLCLAALGSTLEQVVSQHPASLERSQSAVQLGGSVERATGRVTRREAEDGAEAIELQRRASVTRLEHGFTNEFEALDRGRRPRGEAAVLMAQRSAVAVPDYRFTNEFEALDDAYQERAASV